MLMYSDILLTFKTNSQENGADGNRFKDPDILISTGTGYLSAATGQRCLMPCEQIETPEWNLILAGALYPYQQSVAAQKVSFLSSTDANLLNGHFFIIAWNKFAHKWHIWTNRLGTLHLYYAGNEGSAALGTFHPAVAAAASQRKLDWLGLAGFFQFGFFPGDKTFYEDVHILQPASHYVFSEKGRLLRQERYWDWKHQTIPQQSYEEALEEFTSLFDQVMENVSNQGKVAVPISGGLDSRSTVAAVFHPGQERSRFWCYSYGYSSHSTETRIATQIARARQLPFRAFTIQPYLFDHIHNILAAVEGFQDITQCRQAFVQEELGKHAEMVVAAHWGDVWLDTMGLNENSKSLSSEQFLEMAWKKFSKRGGSELVDIICQPHFPEENQHYLLKQSLGNKAESLKHIQDDDFRLKALKTDLWSFRWTLVSIRMFQAAAWPCLPFYDNRIVDFFCRIPSSFVHSRQMQIDYLKKKAPDLANIVWQPFDSNLYRYNKVDLMRFPRRAVRKAWRIARKQENFQRNWEVQFLNPQGKAGLEHWLLRPGLRIHDFISSRQLDELIGNLFSKPDAVRGYQVSILLSFSAWLEKYG